MATLRDLVEAMSSWHTIGSAYHGAPEPVDSATFLREHADELDMVAVFVHETWEQGSIYSEDSYTANRPLYTVYYNNEAEEEEPEEEEDEPEGNYPVLYVDGDRLDDVDMLEVDRVQVEFPAASNGMQSDAQERGPLGWCNSAAISLDRRDDAVTVSISVGDPRGAFAFTVRRLSDGRLVLHTPYPGEGMAHMQLREMHPGTYEIGE